jgi:hypothetical protein
MRQAAKALVGMALLLLLAAGSTAPTASGATVACPPIQRNATGVWKATPTTAPWQWQLQGKIDTSVPACVFDIDGFETPHATVAALQRSGRVAICYLDVGSWERYRPDAKRFPRAVIGRRYEGFPDERWLDIAHFHRFAPILERRFRLCAHKGFDAVEPDNLAGFENRTGFPLTAADQLRFNRWVAARVRALGMAVALKNDPRQVSALLPRFDFAIVEQCFQYEECGNYKPFVAADKAVFEAEYEQEPSAYCGAAKSLDFSAIRKSYGLFSQPWEPCE